MNDLRWWLVEGVIVDIYFDSEKYSGTSIIEKDIIYDIKHTYTGCYYVPRGVPFDCMPDWAEDIVFLEEGTMFMFEGTVLSQGEPEPVHSPWVDIRNCPEEWMGKVFEITDELRELVK